MTYTVTSIHVRPNTDTDWFMDAADEDEYGTWGTYVMETYRDTDKLISRTEQQDSLSEDALTSTQVTVWKDKETHDEWVADSTAAAWREKHETYIDENNIVKTVLSMEET